MDIDELMLIVGIATFFGAILIAYDLYKESTRKWGENHE